jgi:thioredoxin-like negative regulator of GroEL
MIATATLLAAIACQRGRADPPPEVISRLALPHLDGSGSFDPAVLSDRKVLVNFWAPWCRVCVGELPELAAAIGESDGAQLVLVMVWGDPAEARNLLASRAMPGVALSDPQGQVAVAIGLDSIPHTIAVDRDGRSIAALHGGHDRRAFRQVLDQIQ